MNSTISQHVRAAWRPTTIAALALVLAAGTGAVANAKPDPGPAAHATAAVATAMNFPLRRIGTQFVRGDYLTGGGVAAPSWIPEWTSTPQRL